MNWLVNAVQCVGKGPIKSNADVPDYKFITRAKIAHPKCHIDGKGGVVFLKTLPWCADQVTVQIENAPLIILDHTPGDHVPRITYTHDTKQLSLVVTGDGLELRRVIDQSRSLLNMADYMLRRPSGDEARREMLTYLRDDATTHPLIKFGASGSDAYIGYLGSLNDSLIPNNRTPEFDSRTTD